jgi:uroporphyrinogen III methyltransferase / synthase
MSKKDMRFGKLVHGAGKQKHGKIRIMKKTAKKTKPLQGKAVLVTRPKAQSLSLRSALERLGARVIELPMIQIGPIRNAKRMDKAIRRFSGYDFLVFTSPNGVRAFAERLQVLNLNIHNIRIPKIAVIGTGTEKELNRMGLRAEVVPSVFSSAGLVRTLRRKKLITGKKFLLFRTQIAPDYLRTCLETAGGRVNEVAVYETRKPVINKEDFNRTLQQVHYVTFTSASTARNFFDVLGKNIKPAHLRYLSIGPVTSEAVRRAGARVFREAATHTMAGLVSAMKNLGGKSK